MIRTLILSASIALASGAAMAQQSYTCDSDGMCWDSRGRIFTLAPRVTQSTTTGSRCSVEQPTECPTVRTTPLLISHAGPTPNLTVYLSGGLGAEAALFAGAAWAHDGNIIDISPRAPCASEECFILSFDQLPKIYPYSRLDIVALGDNCRNGARELAYTYTPTARFHVCVTDLPIYQGAIP